MGQESPTAVDRPFNISICQVDGRGGGEEATMERVPNRRWSGSTVGSVEPCQVG